jgi:hypothetical protein
VGISISRRFSITRKRDPCLRREGGKNLWILYALPLIVHLCGTVRNPPNVVPAHRCGQRAIRPQHLASYFKFVDRQERRCVVGRLIARQPWPMM